MTQSSLNVHLPTPPQAEHLDYLRARVDAAVCITTGADIPTATHILIEGRPTREQLAACPELRALIIPFAGMPPATRTLLVEFPLVAVHNLHHNAPMTAEMAVTLLLAAAKNLLPVDRIFRQNDWTPRYERAPDVILAGKTALILGYGAIGRRVGAVCRALGMTVIGIRRRADGEPGVYPLETLRDWLPRADALLICLPETPDTDGLIGAAELALLPKGAILVNVGRGPVVAEAALYAALKSGHLHSAGSDVWYNYPTSVDSRRTTPPSAYPFGELENMVLSPVGLYTIPPP